MCGIFGAINLDNSKINTSSLIIARDTMQHRGPDSAGVYINPDGNVGLAHRRLSIIDLSPAANQPMSFADGRYTIVFNGEIYNYKSLIPSPSPKDKEDLIPSPSPKEKGVFKTNSDTEIILYLYAKYGKDCLKYLRGMFAFAIWDDHEKTLFAARDRFGIKPFYYLHDEKQFIFSSEIKAIKHYVKNLTTNINALDAFLRTGSVPAPLTIYNEVVALLPGQFLIMHNLQLTIYNYWKFNDMICKSSVLNPQSSSDNIKAPSKLSIEHSKLNIKNSRLLYDSEAKKKIKAALLDTIEAHLVADVEVGAFLSGGLDSTAIVSLMRQCGKEKIKTVSIVFPNSRFDESNYSRLAAKTYNTEHIEIPFYEKDLIDDFENIMAFMDLPTIDGINTYFVSKAAKQAGLKVVLSGLGGDELFGGYPSFNLIPKYKRIKNLPFAKVCMKFAAPLLKNKLPAKAIHYMKNPDEPNAEYKLIRGLFIDDELKSLGWKVGSQQSAVNGKWQNPKQQMTNLQMTNDLLTNDQLTNDPMTNDQLTNDQLTNLQYVSMMESCFYMRNQLLRDSDVFSMAHSIELRVPFVDHLLYKAVLPYLDNAYDKNFPKRMLVEAVGDIPDEIVKRPKMGFTFPFEDWIRNGQLKDLFDNSIKNLNSSININRLPLTINHLHWSRLWALFILSRYF